MRWSDKYAKLVRRTVGMSHRDIREFLEHKGIIPKGMDIESVDYDPDKLELTIELEQERPIVEDVKP